MKILRIVLLIFGVSLVANALAVPPHDRNVLQIIAGDALLAAYVLAGPRTQEKVWLPGVTKPPGVKQGYLPGRR